MGNELVTQKPVTVPSQLSAGTVLGIGQWNGPGVLVCPRRGPGRGGGELCVHESDKVGHCVGHGPYLREVYCVQTSRFSGRIHKLKADKAGKNPGLSGLGPTGVRPRMCMRPPESCCRPRGRRPVRLRARRDGEVELLKPSVRFVTQ